MKKQKIYFICPSNKFVTGGVKQIYKMVETLNENNFDAVLLLKKNNKESWFNSKVPIEISPYIFKKIKYSYKNKSFNFFGKLVLKYLKLKSISLEENSILVFPEIYGPKINEIEPQLKKVIFNQNCYYTFEHFYQNYNSNPYQNTNSLATIVVSEDSKKYLNFTFPEHQVHRLKIGVDTSTFFYSENKQKIISYMPRKLSEDSIQIINILKIRNNLKTWSILPIENNTESEVAEILKKSAIFLSFNHREGFGLPPVEAMACGCFVIGYQGQAGREYFKDEFSSTVPEGNIIQFVKEIENIINNYEIDPEKLAYKGMLAAKLIKENYNVEKEETIKIWEKILFAQE
ncbi:glycosyltransferase [Frigoriflavimonas asaccharolytica]|uniref:Glycosyl transferase family 1 domain-containing protein n=1 Tax=Frigoriflavimonas asaccharolytica TaxID=2735899 RepID=A0A8J8K9A4_9FLAO|nr:glycosyltransferase [Frigoriflavimonas asaccharolytica]NRS93406.1 hypothetical protein [Frigoriflavimonas asaccharolytica]